MLKMKRNKMFINGVEVKRTKQVNKYERVNNEWQDHIKDETKVAVSEGNDEFMTQLVQISILIIIVSLVIALSLNGFEMML